MYCLVRYIRRFLFVIFFKILAPNYCYRCGNLASVLKIYPNDKRKVELYNAVNDAERERPERVLVPYFL